MSFVNRRPRKDHSSENFHSEDRPTVLEEIFSCEGSSSLPKEVDWNLPPIYDKYTKDGHLIVHSIKNSSFMGSDFKDVISKTINKSETRQDAEKASDDCLTSVNLFGYNFRVLN